MPVLQILGALSSVVVFSGAVLVVVKSIIKLINTTEANTKAVVALTNSMEELHGEVGGHTERISRIEGALGFGRNNALHP